MAHVDFRSFDPDGLKFSVNVSAEDMNQGHYYNETFNLEVTENIEEDSENLENEHVPQVTFSNFDQSVDYTQYIKIADTTKDLGVFELGDGDPSQAQWGQIYNSSETVYGSRWDDNIVGSDNDQTFITLSGADSVDETGGDTLIIDGNSADYSFGLRRGGFSIVDEKGVVKNVKSIERISSMTGHSLRQRLMANFSCPVIQKSIGI